MCGIDIEKPKNPELKIVDIKPKWTIIYNKEIYNTHNDVLYEFYWDNEIANNRYDELSKLEKVPTKRPFHDRDYSFLYGNMDNNIIRVHQIKSILIARLKEKYPNCNNNFTIFVTMWTDGDFKIECRHGHSFSNDRSTSMISSIIFEDNEIIYLRQKLVNHVVDERYTNYTKIQ